MDATWLAFHPLSQGPITSASAGTTIKGDKDGSKGDGEGKSEGASSSSSSTQSTMTKEQAIAALVR